MVAVRALDCAGSGRISDVVAGDSLEDGDARLNFEQQFVLGIPKTGAMQHCSCCDVGSTPAESFSS